MHDRGLGHGLWPGAEEHALAHGALSNGIVRPALCQLAQHRGDGGPAVPLALAEVEPAVAAQADHVDLRPAVPEFADLVLPRHAFGVVQQRERLTAEPFETLAAESLPLRRDDLLEGGAGADTLNGGNGAWAAHAGKDVILGVRPEHISDPTNAEAQGPEHHRLDALVEVTEPTGPDTLAVMLLGGVEATARLRADTKARPGELSTFLVDMSKICLFDPATERRIS